MAFVQQTINYAQQYAQELLNAYPYLSYFSAIWAGQNATRFKPVNAKTVMIPSMEVSGASAVNRDAMNGQFARNFNLTWQAAEMSMYREWSTIIDPMDEVETNEVATIANVTRTFNELQKVPEMDAYAAYKLASFATAGSHVSNTVLTAANILGEWDTALASMANGRVNRDRVVAYLTPATYKLLKEAAGLDRFISVTDGIRNVDRNVAKLDGVAIVEVPADMMKTAYDFTVGFAPTAAAKQINMLLADPDAVIAPVVYETSMVTPPSAATKGKTVYYESYYYDVFGGSKRLDGFYANIDA